MSTRLLALSERKEHAAALGEMPRLAELRRPASVVSGALLPVEEVRRRLGECRVSVNADDIRWNGHVSPNPRRPTVLGTVIFSGRDSAGSVVRGALVSLLDEPDLPTTKKWRVQKVWPVSSVQAVLLALWGGRASLRLTQSDHSAVKVTFVIGNCPSVSMSRGQEPASFQ